MLSSLKTTTRADQPLNLVTAESKMQNFRLETIMSVWPLWDDCRVSRVHFALNSFDTRWNRNLVVLGTGTLREHEPKHVIIFVKQSVGRDKIFINSTHAMVHTSIGSTLLAGTQAWFCLRFNTFRSLSLSHVLFKTGNVQRDSSARNSFWGIN